MGFSFTHQALDVFFGQTGRGLDLDGLFLAGAHILGGHVDDTVGVDIEGHFDLRHATGCRRDTGQVEAGHGHVVGRHGTFALQHVDGHGGLVVSGRGEHVALAGGDGGVAVDQLGEHAAHGLDTQGQGRHVQQQHVLHVTGQDAALDGGAHGHHFVGVHGTVGILAEELAHLLLHQGHTGHAAHQDDFVDLVGGKTGVGQSLLAGSDGAVHQVADQGFQLGAGELDHQVLGTGLVGGDEGQVHFRFHGGGQVLLGLFSGFFQALQGHAVLGQVDAVFLLEFFHQVVDDALVEVFAAQEGVTVGGEHFHHVVAHFQDGDIEGAAAQVEHGDLFVGLLVETVGQGGGRGFVDDTLHFQTGDAAGVLGGLTLGVVEVGGHGDDGFGHGFAQVSFGVGLQLGQDHGRNFRSGVGAAVHFHTGVAVGGGGDGVGGMFLPAVHFRRSVLAAHQTLDGEDGALGVGHGLTFGDLANQAFLIGESNHGGSGAAALRIGDALGVLAFHDVDTGVGGPKVDADDFGHMWILLGEIKTVSVNALAASLSLASSK